MLKTKHEFFFLKNIMFYVWSRSQFTFGEGERRKEIIESNSPKQKSLRSAKEHLSTESFLPSSVLTGNKNKKDFLVLGSKNIMTVITITVVTVVQIIAKHGEMFLS